MANTTVGNTTPPAYDDYSDVTGAIDDVEAVPTPDGPDLGVDYDWDYVTGNETGRREYS